MKKGALTAAILFVLVVGVLGAVLLYSGSSGTTGAVPVPVKETFCLMPQQITKDISVNALPGLLENKASGVSYFIGPCCPEKSDCQKTCDGKDCTKEKCDPNFECKTVESNQARCCFPVTTTTTVTSSTSSTVPPSSTTTTEPSSTSTTSTPSTTVTTTPSTTSTTTTPSTTVTTVPPSPSPSPAP